MFRPGPELFEFIVDSSPHIYVVIDEGLRVSYANPAVRDVLGWEPEDLVGRPISELVHPDDLALGLAALDQLVAEFDDRPGEGIPMTMRLLTADAREVVAEVGAKPAFEHPQIRGMVLRGRAMTGQQLLDNALQALVASSPLEEVLEFLAASLSHELVGAAVAIGFDWTGEGFARVVHTGLTPRLIALLDGTARVSANAPLHSPWGQAMARRELVAAPDLDDLPDWLAEPSRDAGRPACWAAPVSVPPDGAQLACIVVWRELTGDPWVSHRVSLDRACQLTALAFERRHTEELLRFAALHDTLTGISNRSAFFNRLRAAAVEEGKPLLGVLYVDLDGFKPVNDTHGHAAGDDLLRAVAQRLTAVVRPEDLVARLGGDEFAVLCPGLATADEATVIADRLVDAVARPLDLDGTTVRVGASVGLAVCEPGPDTDAEHLLDQADRALYAAKLDGKGRWRLAGADT